MTKHSRRKSRNFYLVMLLSLLSLSTNADSSGARPVVGIASIAQLVKDAHGLFPLSRGSVESAFGVALRPVRSGSPEKYEFFAHESLVDKPGSLAIDIDLRLALRREKDSLLVLRLESNECSDVDSIRRLVGNLVLQELPRGHSARETIWYSRQYRAGRLSLGFDGTKGCLVEVVLTEPAATVD